MRSKQLPVSSRPEFVALPSDPTIPLTPEQDKALWGGDVNAMLRDITKSAMRDTAYIARLTQQPHQPSTLAVSELRGA